MENIGRVSGGPAWAKSARFDIHAKADGAFPASALAGMLQALLAERFKARVHEETKQVPVYALVLVDRRGKLGPNIQRVSSEEATYCDALEAAPQNNESAPPRDSVKRCSGSGRGGIRLRGSHINDLGTFLAELLGRPVIDKTGLPGRFDIDLLVSLNWDHLVAERPSDEITNSAVFEELKSQLGLKAESTRGPVRTIVIDSAKPPSQN